MWGRGWRWAELHPRAVDKIRKGQRSCDREPPLLPSYLRVKAVEMTVASSNTAVPSPMLPDRAGGGGGSSCLQVAGRGLLPGPAQQGGSKCARFAAAPSQLSWREQRKPQHSPTGAHLEEEALASARLCLCQDPLPVALGRFPTASTASEHRSRALEQQTRY